MENNLSLYHIFHAVAHYGNISKAAKDLYISQPAISKAIQKLEQNLNTPLFIRNSRGVLLTDEGKMLYDYTRTAFSALQEGESNIQKIHSAGIGHIRIGVSTTLCKYIMIPYLKEFIWKYPHIKISISCQSSSHTLRLLEDEKLDIGLIGQMGNLKKIRFNRLGEIEDIFVASKSYLDIMKLHDQEESKNILTSSNLMLLDETNISRQHIDNYLKTNHINTNQILEISNMDLLIEFAKIGLGTACVIKEFIQDELKEGKLVEIPILERIPRRVVGFVVHENANNNDAVSKFLQFSEQNNNLLSLTS